MLMESKGILLLSFGKPQYGMMAYQLAMSIKYHSPSIPIHLITDQSAVSKLRTMAYFDTVEYIETPIDPAQVKIDLYDRLPFDHTLFMDVDGLCLSEMDSLFVKMMASDKPFQCFVHAYYSEADPPDLPLMVWAKRDTIWEHYKLNGETLPATQSSFLYIRKGEMCERIYRTMQANYRNRIPLDKLKYKWGGGQPDELYLNVTLAQLGYDPHVDNVIYFANEQTLKPHQLKHQYKILSLFGTSSNVKKIYENFYNTETRGIANHFGERITYEWKAIKNAKHANIRQAKPMKTNAFNGKFIRSEPLPRIPVVKRGRTLLFTSFFDSGNPHRQAELMHCLDNNLRNDAIDTIYLFDEANLQKAHPKLVVIPHARPTYQAMIDKANEVSAPDDIVIIGNSDIHFDQTITWPQRIAMDRVMIALSRWDVRSNNQKKLFAYEHSQDTWIFKGKINLSGCDYFMGLPGCDNRIAFDANKAGYKVVNTAKDIITYHIHASNVRSYTQEDRLEGGYLPVYITSIRSLASSRLLIIQPGKVGDIICVLPIAKYYADRGYSVEWECPVQYHAMFAGYIDYVTPVVKRSGDYAREIDLSFGINKQSSSHAEWLRRRASGDSFVQVKYDMAGVPISELRNLQYKRNDQLETMLYDHITATYGDDYDLVHLVSDYGSPVPVDAVRPQIVFSPVQGFSIFDWRKVIENAVNVHCIDSSLCNFVDALPQRDGLYYYISDRVPMKGDRTVLVKEWDMINVMETIES